MEVNRLPCEFILPKGKPLQDLVECVKDWALFNGAAMRSRTQFSPDIVEFAPFTLLPSSFPRKEFEKAVHIQSIFNELIHNVAHDHEFLKNSLKNVVEVDSFTKRLFDIYEIVYAEGFTQSYCLGLLRSDYMVDSKKDTLFIKQVEINTIASSLAGLSTQFSSLHKFVLERLQRFDDVTKLPENNALSGLSNGLIEAWKIYNNPSALILMIVEDVSYNICDQRFHEFEMYKLNPKVTVLRRTFTEISMTGRLDSNKILFVEDKEVAVVYFRAGYSPDQYFTEKEWDVRLMIERSKALKCPSIQYHLAGTKKVQQALASENVLAKFLKDPEKIKEVKNIFTGLYSLDLDNAGNKAVEMAFNSPHHFVLKPQREGGGNNVYGDEIPKVISTFVVLSKIGNTKERTAYILMNRIQPPVQLNYIIRPGNTMNIVAQDVVSELGIYGVIIGTENEILINKQVGHMLRTKGHLVNEGGVAAGVGALDSPLLL